MSCEQSLKQNPYPGRGIVAGLNADGKLTLVYWLMGRSENSRNRVFVQDGGTIRTEAKDPSKLTDPTLIIYNAARVAGHLHIVTNGDQTDTIYEAVTSGGTLETALLTRHYEPDAPNFTPRISCVADTSKRVYTLAINKTLNGGEDAEEIRFFRYLKPSAGIGHCIHTYASDGDPLPSFATAPQAVVIEDTAAANAEKFWGLLNAENRVALFAKVIDRDGSSDICII